MAKPSYPEPNWLELSTKKIALYGGSFDPPHQGHWALAMGLVDLGYHVLVIPSQNPIAKEAKGRASAQHRLEMCKIAFGGVPEIDIWSFELEREGTSYAIDIVRACREQLPEAELSFVIGMDLVPGLARWKEAGELFSLVSLLVVRRPGEDIVPQEESFCPYRLLELPEVAGSSREIRQWFASYYERCTYEPCAYECSRCEHCTYEPCAGLGGDEALDDAALAPYPTHPDLSAELVRYVIEHKLYSRYTILSRTEEDM